MESHDEDGPIGAICFEVGNVGREEFNDGRSGHYGRNVAAMFIELDLGRAHNLWKVYELMNMVMLVFTKLDAYLAWCARCLADTQRVFLCSGTNYMTKIN
jgi:hypothetical protein